MYVFSYFSGIVNEKLLSDYLHHVFPASSKIGPASAAHRWGSELSINLPEFTISEIKLSMFLLTVQYNTVLIICTQFVSSMNVFLNFLH